MSKFVISLDDKAAQDANISGPKCANQAMLAQCGLPTPGGFVLTAEGYRHQLEALELTEAAEKAVSLDFMESRQWVSKVRIALFEQEIVPEIQDALLEHYHALVAKSGNRIAVRSSSLMEDTEGSSFAGQFQTFLGVETEADFITTVRACWGALWSSRAMRYMDDKNIKATDTAMAVLVQPLVEAICSGGGLSQTPAGGMSVSAIWGLGEALAQGEVVPDRYDLTEDGKVFETLIAKMDGHSAFCAQHGLPAKSEKPHIHGPDGPATPCLTNQEVEILARHMKTAEREMGHEVEIEWAKDEAGIKLLQARPLHVEEVPVPDELFKGRASLKGHPGGLGWGSGKACVINCECEIGRIAPGDVLVTKVAGPALAQVLTRVSAVVAERGGSTSHLASLGRERGIPMVLGVLNATSEIPEGAMVGVDGVQGLVRWIKNL